MLMQGLQTYMDSATTLAQLRKIYCRQELTRSRTIKKIPLLWIQSFSADDSVVSRCCNCARDEQRNGG